MPEQEKQGAMYHLEEELPEDSGYAMTTELFVFFDEHGLNLYIVEDDYLVQEPYVFADKHHLLALGKANFKGLLTYTVNRKDGHPILTEEQRRSFNGPSFDDTTDRQIAAGQNLLAAFEEVANLYMGTKEEAAAQAMSWLNEQVGL